MSVKDDKIHKGHDSDQHRYDDIINLPHHVSSVHPHMSMAGRAAQFSPFAALTGYDDAIVETRRLTDEKTEISEDVQAVLDRKMQIVRQRVSEHPEIEITYFQPDEKKSGGTYITLCAAVKKFDAYGQVLIMQNGMEIPVTDITGLEGDIFSVLDGCEE